MLTLTAVVAKLIAASESVCISIKPSEALIQQPKN